MWRRKLRIFLGHRDHVSVLQASSAGLNDLLLSQESKNREKEPEQGNKMWEEIKKRGKKNGR